MGFDLYGLNPKENVEPPVLLEKFKDNDGWNDWSKMNQTDKDEYFKLDDEDKLNNPGRYFRANVWWWRPLWSFVIGACSNILTDKDIEYGSCNDGHKISKTKSIRIAVRLKKLDKMGIIKIYEDDIKPGIKKAEEHNKKLEIKMAVLREEVRMNVGDNVPPGKYPEPFKTKWRNLCSKKDWTSEYPFSADFVMEFAKFCEQSGGFKIC